MQVEILNTINFLLFVLIAGGIYYYAKRKGIIKKPWKLYWFLMFASALISYQQFFTLTEKADVKNTQVMMLKQSDSMSDSKIVDEYLKNTEQEQKANKKKPNKTLLSEQQAISEALAQKIEQSYEKENK